jgi:transposase-like protein
MKRVAKKEPVLKNVLKVDEGEIRAHLNEVVRSSVEETLNGLLDAEAERLCRAGRYERTPERADRGNRGRAT